MTKRLLTIITNLDLIWTNMTGFSLSYIISKFPFRSQIFVIRHGFIFAYIKINYVDVNGRRLLYLLSKSEGSSLRVFKDCLILSCIMGALHKSVGMKICTMKYFLYLIFRWTTEATMSRATRKCFLKM